MEVSVWVAVAAGAPGVIALVLLAFVWRSQARMRSAQQVLLPDGSTAPLVDRQAALQRAMARVEQGLADLESLVERQGEVTERGLRTSLRFHGMVRYDAYRDMGGAQSWSIALLDGNQTGSIITSLHARDHARVYLKEMVEGVAGQRLSPEEERAVAVALDRPPVEEPPTAAPRPPRAAAVEAQIAAQAEAEITEEAEQHTGEFPTVADDGEPPVTPPGAQV